MKRRYLLPFLVAHCGAFAVGCSQNETHPIENTAEFSAALFASDPAISDEIEIGKPVLEKRTSVESKIAFGADEYLVVWSIPTYMPSAHMYASRVSPAGEVLDPAGFYVGPGYPSDVVFANGQFVVVSTPLTGSPSGDIRLTRILPSGQVLDPGGIVVAPDDPTTMIDVFPTIVSDGTDYLVAWTENANFPTIFRALRLARVTSAGVVVDPGGLLVTDLIPWTSRPSMAFDGNQFLLTWAPNFDQVYGMRVSKSADLIDTKPIIIDELIGNHWNSKVVFDGTQFVVGSSLVKDNTAVVRLRRVATNGTVDPTPIEVSTGSPTAFFGHMAFDGNRLVVALEDSTQKKTYSWHVNLDGTTLEPIPQLLADKSVAPHVAAGASGQSMLVWKEEAAEPATLRGFTVGTRMDASGKMLDVPALPMSVRAGAETAPRATFDGKNYILVRRDDSGFLATRLSPAGMIVDEIALPFGKESLASNQVAHVSSSGSSGPTWIVVTLSESSKSSRLVRVSSDGKVLDDAPVQLPPSNLGPLAERDYLAAVDPDGILFVGAQDTGIPFALRVTNDGQVQPLVTLGSLPCVPHSLTFDGAAYFLTCSTPTGKAPQGDYESTLLAARVSTQGQLLDADWKTLTTVPNSMLVWFDAAFDGKNHTLLWRTDVYGEGVWPNFPRTLGLHAMTVSPTGDVVANASLLVPEVQGCGTAAERSLRPALASTNGKNYVVWSESSNVSSCDASHLDLMGVEIDGTGVVSPKFVVSAETGMEDSANVVSGPDGQLLVAYGRFVPEAPYAAVRARARLVNPCVCADGQSCVAGVCASTTGGDKPPSKEPITFGGCGCRLSDDERVNVWGGLSMLALAMVCRRRLGRQTKRVTRA